MPVAKPSYSFTPAEYNEIAYELQTGGNGSFARKLGELLAIADLGNANGLAELFNKMFYYSLERAQNAGSQDFLETK